MKKLKFAIVGLLGILSGASVSAQTMDDIDWKNYAREINSEILTTVEHTLESDIFGNIIDVYTKGDKKYVYLFNKTAKMFVSSGGMYGMEMIPYKVGTRFYITQAYKDHEDEDGIYILHSNQFNLTSNDGDCLSYENTNVWDGNNINNSDCKIWLDRYDTTVKGMWDFRPNAYPNWELTYDAVNKSYKMINYDVKYKNVEGITDEQAAMCGVKYIAGENVFVKCLESEADEWYIVTESDFLSAVSALPLQYIDITGLLLDSRFNRDDVDVNFWKWAADGEPEVDAQNGGTGSGTGFDNDYYSLMMGLPDNLFINYNDTHYKNVDGSGNPVWTNSEVKDGDVNKYDGNEWALITRWGSRYTAELNGAGTLQQTVTGLEPGLYRVSCQGFYVGSADSKKGYLFANDSKVELKYLTGDDLSNFEYWKQEAWKEATNSYLTGMGIFSNDGNAYNDKLREMGFQFPYYQGFNNVGAGLMMYDSNGTENDPYRFDVFVEVGADGVLRLGAINEDDDLDVYVDNFELYYSSASKEFQMYLSANNTDVNAIDQYVYNRPTVLNLRRHFDLNKWNALTLPIDLTGDQIKIAFGNDAKLAVLRGVSPTHNTLIVFDPVDLNVDGIRAGECYVLNPTKEADYIDVSETRDFRTLMTQSIALDGTETYTTSPFSAKGPLYVVNGVTRTASENEAIFGSEYDNGIVTREYQMDGSDKTLIFKGYYVKPKNGAENVKYPQDSYFMENGKMYHLSSAWGSIYATMWYLLDKNRSSQARGYNFSIGDEEIVLTGIQNVETTENSVNLSGVVYTVDGQKVKSDVKLNELPHGLYIINGKKVVK